MRRFQNTGLLGRADGDQEPCSDLVMNNRRCSTKCVTDHNHALERFEVVKSQALDNTGMQGCVGRVGRDARCIGSGLILCADSWHECLEWIKRISEVLKQRFCSMVTGK